MRSARVPGVLLALCAGLPADAREFRWERSGGKLGMTVLGHDDRDSENYTAAQVRNGQLDMARINLAVLNNMAPVTAVLARPNDRGAISARAKRARPAGRGRRRRRESGKYCRNFHGDHRANR